MTAAEKTVRPLKDNTDRALKKGAVIVQIKTGRKAEFLGAFTHKRDGDKLRVSEDGVQRQWNTRVCGIEVPKRAPRKKAS